MTALPAIFPRVPLKQMDPSMLVFELDRETARLMPEACELITSAATMASFLHRNQTRMVRGDLPTVPYIEHPLRVALRLIRWGVDDPELIAAALLHDVVEDCSAELLEHFGRSGEESPHVVARLYGARVADLVLQVTNPIDGTSYHEHLKGLASSGSIALLIKASDLKDNAGSIRYQLGHGKDARLLRMLRKYHPATAVVQVGLGVLVGRLGDAVTPIHRAVADLEHLESVLVGIADERSIDLDA